MCLCFCSSVFLCLFSLSYHKNPSQVLGLDRKICPEDHRLASRGLSSDAKLWYQGRDFSIPPSHNNWIIFLAHHWLFILKYASQSPWIRWYAISHDDVTLPKHWRHLTTMCASSNTSNEQSCRDSLSKIHVPWVRWEFLTQDKIWYHCLLCNKDGLTNLIVAFHCHFTCPCKSVKNPGQWLTR